MAGEITDRKSRPDDIDGILALLRPMMAESVYERKPMPYLDWNFEVMEYAGLLLLIVSDAVRKMNLMVTWVSSPEFGVVGAGLA